MSTNRVDFRTLRQLLFFAAVCEEGSFRKAAKRLNLSVPTLIEQIDALESRRRIRLLERSPRGVKLSAAGRVFFPEVRRLLDQAESLEYALGKLPEAEDGLITIGANAESMLFWVPRFLQRLKALEPRIAVQVHEIDSANAEKDLEQNTVSFAVGYFEGVISPDLNSMVIAKERFIVVLPPDHAFCARKSVTWDDLRDQPFVTAGRDSAPSYYDLFIATCRQKGITPDIRHVVASCAKQLAFISCGQGIAVMPESFANWMPSYATYRPIEDAEANIVLSVAWNSKVQSKIHDKALGAFRNLAEFPGETH